MKLLSGKEKKEEMLYSAIMFIPWIIGFLTVANSVFSLKKIELQLCLATLHVDFHKKAGWINDIFLKINYTEFYLSYFTQWYFSDLGITLVEENESAWNMKTIKILEEHALLVSRKLLLPKPKRECILKADYFYVECICWLSCSINR